MADQALKGKRVLIREDLNVPVKDGRVTSTARIDAALPTLRAALEAGARVMVMSHLGRPKEGKPDAASSLAPVAAKLSEVLFRDVPLVVKWLDGVDVAPGEIVLCENVRFNVMSTVKSRKGDTCAVRASVLVYRCWINALNSESFDSNPFCARRLMSMVSGW